MLNRLIGNWVYGGVMAGILLLLLSPLFISKWPSVLIATFLHLPAYMVHQYEEHDQDRFRLFFNQTLGKGYDVLSPMAVFITNVPGVWGVMVISLYAATMIHQGWALVAVYLVLVNALVHILHALIFWRYNPGLVTALAIFLPLGGATLYLIHDSQSAGRTHHVWSLISAVAIHAAILIHVQRKLAVMRSSTQ
jgi:Protein of unknown function with HXXEE motif